VNRLLIGSSDKTTLLLQYLSRDFPNGLILIDPTGTLAEAAADTVPVELTQRTLYLDPSDLEFPVGLNVLDGVAPDARHTVAESICAYFEAMWPNGWGAQSNFILANCLRLLLDTPGSTFLGVLRLLQDPEYPKFLDRCLANCTDPVVQKNWGVIKSWQPSQYATATSPLQNKIGTLLMSPVIRNILGQQHSTFALDRGHIIIANLDRAKIGDATAFLLGSLLITRSKGPIYINDLGFYASDYLATFLPQDRFTIACQFLDELPKKLQQAVLAIPDKAVFKTTKEDADRLAFYVGIANPTVLTDLDLAEARLRDEVIRPTAPPATPRLEAIKRRSRACYSRPRDKVELALQHYFAA